MGLGCHLCKGVNVENEENAGVMFKDVLTVNSVSRHQVQADEAASIQW